MDDGIFTVLRAVAFGAAISVVSAAIRKWCDGAPNYGYDKYVPLRPRPEVFGTAWLLLFVTTGVGWVLGNTKADIGLTTVTLLCCAWLVAYPCLQWKRVSAGILAATAAVSIATSVALGTSLAAWFIHPLSAWTAFATYLNTYEAFFATSKK